MKTTFNNGFTRTELIVVVLVIGLLACLLFPALNSTKITTRRDYCIYNQRNIALALTMFEQNKSAYPHFRSYTDARTDNSRAQNSFNNITEEIVGEDGTIKYVNQVGWIPPLLPYVESTSLYMEICEHGYTTECDVKMDIFYCRSVGYPKENNVNHYVVNCGIADRWPYVDETKAYGIFTDGIGDGSKVGKSISSDDIKDGLSNTLLLSENLQAGTIWSSKEYLVGFCMNYNTKDGDVNYEPLFNEGPRREDNPGIPFRPNLFREEAPNYASNTDSSPDPVCWNVARMSSVHPGVVIAAMADGSVRAISEKVDAEILTRAMAPNDEETGFWKNNKFRLKSFKVSKLGD